MNHSNMTSIMQSRGLTSQMVETYIKLALNGQRPDEATLSFYLENLPDEQIALLRQHTNAPAVPHIPSLPSLDETVSLPVGFDSATLTADQIPMVVRVLAQEARQGYKGTTGHQMLCRVEKLLNAREGRKGESLIATQERMKAFSPEVLARWDQVRLGVKPYVSAQKAATGGPRKPAKLSAWEVFRTQMSELMDIKKGNLGAFKGMLELFGSSNKQELLDRPETRNPAWVYSRLPAELRARCSKLALSRLGISEISPVVPVATESATVL